MAFFFGRYTCISAGGGIEDRSSVLGDRRQTDRHFVLIGDGERAFFKEGWAGCVLYGIDLGVRL